MLCIFITSRRTVCLVSAKDCTKAASGCWNLMLLIRVHVNGEAGTPLECTGLPL